MGTKKNPPNIAAVGVPTTTPIAFLIDGTLFLERMSAIARDGAGVLCDTVPPTGTILPVVFRLSTAPKCTRARAEVLGPRPTTPRGLRHAQEHGEEGTPLIPSGGISDSATAIFRLGDLPRPSPAPSAGATATPVEERTRARGFCIHFLELDSEVLAAIDQHIRTSRALTDRLAAQGGISEADARLAIADSFHEGDLSKRALDW